MSYWLVKFAPFRYSWKDCLRNGKFEIYSIRNPQSANNLQKMKIDDEVLFYHSQEDRSIMGKMKVVQESHQDPTTSNPRWVSVTFEPVASFDKPLSLAVIKSTPSLSEIGLIRQPRLSVMPLTIAEFEIIKRLATNL